MRALLVVPLSALLLVPACGSNPPGSPGSGKPGDSCGAAADCGCWSCACQGVAGAPGGAQLCDGVCPTGEEACASVCAIAGAKVASATSSSHCPAVP